MAGRDYFTAKLNIKQKMKLVDMIRKKLSPARIQLFRDTCFGYWLDLSEASSDPILCHAVLQRQIIQDDLPADEMHFSIHGVAHPLVFGPREFCLITALPFGSEPHLRKNRSNGFVKTVFGDAKLTVDTLTTLFNLIGTDGESTRHINDDYAVRICLLMMVEVFFIGHQGFHKICPTLLRAVDDMAVFNVFPWGSYIYETTLRHMHGAIERRMVEKGSGEFRYSLCGFVYAFKIWILETFPNSSSSFIKGMRYPRALRWGRLTSTIYSEHALRIIRVSEPDEHPQLRLIAEPQEAAQDWYIRSMNYLNSADRTLSGTRHRSKRSRVREALLDDSDPEEEGDGHPAYDMASPSRTNIGRGHDDMPFQHEPTSSYQPGPSFHHVHSPHDDAYVAPWDDYCAYRTRHESEYTMLRDDFDQYRTRHESEYTTLRDDFDQYQTRHGLEYTTLKDEFHDYKRVHDTEHGVVNSRMDANDRKILELEKLIRTYHPFTVPEQQHGGQASQAADSSQMASIHVQNIGDDFVNEMLNVPPFMTPHGTSAGFSGQSAGGYASFTGGQYQQTGTIGSMSRGPLFPSTPVNEVHQPPVEEVQQPAVQGVRHSTRDIRPSKWNMSPYTTQKDSTGPVFAAAAQHQKGKGHQQKQVATTTVPSVAASGSSSTKIAKDITFMHYQQTLKSYWLTLLSHTIKAEFWPILLGLKGQGYLEEEHIDAWGQYLMNQRTDEDTWTIMPSSFMEMINREADPSEISRLMIEPVHWATLENVFFPICLNPRHWIVGHLCLDTMKLTIYDSLISPEIRPLISDLLGKFKKCLPELLLLADCEDLIPKSTNIVCKNASKLPRQNGPLGDCGVYACHFLECLAKKTTIIKEANPQFWAANFRARMAAIFWEQSVDVEY